MEKTDPHIFREFFKPKSRVVDFDDEDTAKDDEESDEDEEADNAA
jgi:hypothetical protein